MKSWALLVLIIFSLSPFSKAFAIREKETKWVRGEISSPDLNFNNLRFTNRAQCAIDSESPAESAFILLNNTDAAKGIYRLAKNTGNNSSELTKMGIQVFRYTVIQMMEFIHEKIISNDLPLLPADLTQRNVPSRYQAISKDCKNDEYCKGLDLYMAELWSASTSNSSYRFSKVDDFNSKKNFLEDKVFVDRNHSKKLGCHYLKKFSPLEAHLYGTKPTAKVFEKLAKTMINKDEYLADCYDFEAQENMTMGLFQIEVNSLNERKWKKVGFDYWNSMKLYFSWAWRNAPEFSKMAAPLDKVLRGVTIEEAVLIVPNGCKSIEAPKCNGDYLSLNSMRQFAKKNFTSTALATDILSPLPEGPQADLLDNEMPAINTDILDLAEFETSDKWLRNFSKNLSDSRIVMKRKLIAAINALNVITQKVSPKKILDEVKNRFRGFGFSGEKINLSGYEEGELTNLKNELYYFCGEFTQAAHDDLSFIKGDLEILKKTTIIDHLATQFSEKKTNEFYSFYKELATLATKTCNKLNQEGIWSDGFKLDKGGYSRWYLEKIYEGKVASNERAVSYSFLDEDEKPFLFYKNYNDDKSFDNVICVNGTHCARKVLQSIVDLYSVAQYANTFWEMDQKMKSPALFNPYAERTQCKVYDPWFKVKSTIFDLFNTAGQAAMSAFIPGAVFAGFSLQPGRVTSFNQLVKDGKISYDINRTKTRVVSDLLLDFGPLLGIPCTISVSRHLDSNPYQYLSFAGVSVGACVGRRTSEVNVYTASDIGEETTRGANFCASCSLNFQSVTNSLTAISNFSPYAGPGLFMLKGLVDLINNLRDPDNIPRNWKANPNFVMDTYRRFGEIPKKCEKPLRKGRRCFKTKQEEKVNDLVKRVLKTNVVAFKAKTRVSSRVKIKVAGCDKWIKGRLRIGRGNGNLEMPSECAHLVRGEINELRDHNFISEFPELGEITRTTDRSSELSELARLTLAQNDREKDFAVNSFLKNVESGVLSADIEDEAEIEEVKIVFDSPPRVTVHEEEKENTVNFENVRRLEALLKDKENQLREAERLEAKRLEADRLEAKRLEAEKLEIARREVDRLETERLESERLESSRLETERLEIARRNFLRLEAERIKNEKREAARIEAKRRELEVRREMARREAERKRVAAAAARNTPSRRIVSSVKARVLKVNDCLISKTRDGSPYVFLKRLKLSGSLGVNKNASKHYLAGFYNKIPLFKRNSNQSTLFISNQSISLESDKKHIAVFSKNSSDKVLVNIEKCYGYDSSIRGR